MAPDFDLYVPEVTGSAVMLVLQGADIPRARYEPLATALCTAGHWVVVPDCIPAGRTYLCPDELSVCRVLSELRTRSLACAAAVEMGTLFLVGHSAGGVAAFESLREWPGPGPGPCGIAVYGSSIPPSAFQRADGPPLLMMCGEKDELVPPRQNLEALGRLAWPAKRAIELPGLDHAGILRPEAAGAIAAYIAAFVRG